MSDTTIRIVSRWNSDKVLFECKIPEGVESRLAMRHALEKAVSCVANLSDAYLSGANLSRADLSDAYLSKIVPVAQQIERIDKVREIILDNAERLNMRVWHEGDSWRDRTCAEEAICGTTHCLAGWLQVCSTDPDIRRKDPEHAGFLCAPIAEPLFFSESAKVLTWLRDREYVKQLATVGAERLESGE